MAIRTPLFTVLLALSITAIGYAAQNSEKVYVYNANVSLINLGTPGIVTLLGLEAVLTTQDSANKTVIQLKNATSFAYNDFKKNFSKPNKFVFAESGHLLKPFIVNYKYGKVVTISVEPDDELWSVNIKRALASIFQVDFDKLGPESMTEKTLYGICKVKYQVNFKGDEIELKKYFNNSHCESKTKDDCSHHQVPEISKFLEYTYRLRNNKLITRASITERVEQFIAEELYLISFQNQTFDLLSSSDVEKAMDFDKVTVVKDIAYEYDDETCQGRRIMHELVPQWMWQARGLLQELDQRLNQLQDSEHHEVAHCLLTPDLVRTFGGKVIRDYSVPEGIYTVAYVECKLGVGNMLVFNSGGGSAPREMSFKLWSGGLAASNQVFVRPAGSRLHVSLNDQRVCATTLKDGMSITFLADDSVRVETAHQEIFYTKEYIMVKMNATHASNMCGLCDSSVIL